MPHNSDDVEYTSGAIDDNGNATFPGTARQNRETLFGSTDEEIELLDGTRYGELSFESYVNLVRREGVTGLLHRFCSIVCRKTPMIVAPRLPLEIVMQMFKRLG